MRGSWKYQFHLGIICLVLFAVAIISLKLQSASVITDDSLNQLSGASEVMNKVLTAEDFASPASGAIIRSTGYYYSDTRQEDVYHYGTDYAEPEGTAIRAICAGTVSYAGEDSLLGYRVVMNCGQGWQITYGCLENLRVKAGDVIEANSLLGQVAYSPGADSQTGQQQLHVELLHNNEVQEIK